MWKLWLDDQLDDPVTPERHTPNGYMGAKSSNEAVDLVKQHGLPAFIDFDFDLGGTDTAMSFLHDIQWQHPDGPVPGYRVHSRNPCAKDMIASFMESWRHTTVEETR